MARIPEPRPGLIFRYGYVWLEDYLRGHLDPAKDRPACIFARVVDGMAAIEAVKGLAPTPGDVLILPITTSPPRAQELTVEMNRDNKRACGLDVPSRSWVIVSEFNLDVWPNADLSLIPGTNRFDYGMAPPGLFRRIGQGVLEARRLRRQSGLRR